jgi:subtilisin family serine protease
MRINKVIGILACALATTLIATSIPSESFASTTDELYVVQVSDGQLADLTASLAHLGEVPDETMSQGPDAALVRLTPLQATHLQDQLPGAQISLDQSLTLADTQSSSPWHLASLNRTGPSDTTGTNFSFPTTAGDGVDVFVIDSGVEFTTYNDSNDELYGRVAPALGKNFVHLNGWTASNTDDCYSIGGSLQTPVTYGGHGTHVAGIIASRSYGVAKNVTIIPLRAFGCPDGNGNATASMWDVMMAIDFAIAHRRVGHPAIINMSLGGAQDNQFDAKVQAAVEAGITVVVAAGNTSSDACTTSPAAAPGAITVSATAQNSTWASSFSNFGTCVSILAPGVNIPSVDASSPMNARTLSGTSMASPQVAGTAALYLALHKLATPADVKQALTSHALASVISGVPANTPNLLVNSNFMQAPLAVLAIPSTVTVTSRSLASIGLSWTSTTSATTGRNYLISYRAAGTTPWNALYSTRNTATISGLRAHTTYEITVASITGIDIGAPSTPNSATTLSGIPTPVRNLLANNRTRSSVTLTWNKPSIFNGGLLKDYVVQYRRPGMSTWTTFGDGIRITTGTRVTGLRPNTSYVFRVTAKTAQGAGLYAYTSTTRTLRK